MTQAKKILEGIPGFLEKILDDLKKLGLDVSDLTVDHVCCRTETESDYFRLKEEFSVLGEILSEARISGRPITTVRLHEPVAVGRRTVSCVEIPAPKIGRRYATGLEHCEFVIQESFEKFAASYPQLSWDWTGAGKRLNAELALSLSDERSVKFHHLSLEEVIRIEEAESLLKKS